MLRIVRFLSIILLTISPILLQATNYYASLTGTGNGSSIDSPCSLSAGLSKPNAGDTLFLRGGQYDLTTTLKFTNSGTADKRVAMVAYADETPILDFRGQAYGARGVQFSGDYQYVRGITIRYTGKNAFYVSGSYSIFENCTTYGNGDTGFQLKNCCGNLVKNCDSYDNCDYQLGDLAAADYGGNADGFADKQYSNTGDPNVFDGCRAWNNSDDGWDFFQKVGNTEIRNSVCYKNGPAYYDMRDHPRYEVDKKWFDQFATPLTVIDADGNNITVSLENYTNLGNGNGFKVGGDYTVHNVVLTNCIAVQNTVKGFDQNNNVGSMTVYNCSAFENGRDYGFSDKVSNDGTTHAELTIKNCVSLSSKAKNTFTTGQYLVSSNNSWNTSGVSCTAADFISTSNPESVISARKADGSLPDITFMQLADGSYLIDAGVNVGLPYGGNAPDLGCFERGNLDNFPAAVSTPENKTQTIQQGEAISDIVFTWSAGATSLTYEGLPAGINPTINSENKTLTLSGKPSEAGKHHYTVSTVGGSGDPMTVSGSIVVVSATAKRIAFVTVPNSAEDLPILNKLYELYADFSVEIKDASKENDYSNYDLILISSKPESKSAGLASIEALDKPKLLLKPFQLQKSRWDWAPAGINTTKTSVTVSNKTHPIFTNLTFTGTNGSELELFSQVSTNAVTGVDSWTGAPTVNLLGEASGTNTQSIVEIPLGTSMNGTQVNAPFLMIGLSEYSTAHLTPNATQLIANSCYYLLGLTIPSSIDTAGSVANYKLRQSAYALQVDSEQAIDGLEIYSVMGHRYISTKGNIISTSNLQKGVYILRIKGVNSDQYIKFVKSM